MKKILKETVIQCLFDLHIIDFAAVKIPFLVILRRLK